jgi:hypothetical protein
MKHGKIGWQLAVPLLAIVAISVVSMPAVAQMTSVGISCSQISALHLLQQDNMRAGRALVECGVLPAGGSNKAGDAEDQAPAPPNVLVSNRSCSSQSSCTKSESMVWGNGNTVVVNYNDHTGGLNYSGLSVSDDGGATFTEIIPPPLSTGHGDNFGDPIVVWNAKLGKWFAGDLADGCGGQGIALWTSTDGHTWTPGACAHNNSGDDRESFWVDNEPASAFYGRMYISWNDFNFGGGALSVTHSDDGINWSSPVHATNGFIRDVQVTGTPPGVIRSSSIAKNTVFVAAMDEGGGGFNTRQNTMFRSTDGGASFTSSSMGPRFAATGDVSCGYFVAVAPIIRHMGWGQPAVGPRNVVHYAYSGAGSSGDHGDIFYVRSADNGLTWSNPIEVNQDTDAQFKTQWMPSVSTDKDGKVTISWYDRRQATSACNVATDAGCRYERWARQSADNGATFQSEFVVSSSLIDQPEQDDPGVQSCYAGDYDYNTTQGGNAYITWTDGRRAVNGHHVQDVNFASVPLP